MSRYTFSNKISTSPCSADITTFSLIGLRLALLILSTSPIEFAKAKLKAELKAGLNEEANKKVQIMKIDMFMLCSIFDREGVRASKLCDIPNKR